MVSRAVRGPLGPPRRPRPPPGGRHPRAQHAHAATNANDRIFRPAAGSASRTRGALRRLAPGLGPVPLRVACTSEKKDYSEDASSLASTSAASLGLLEDRADGNGKRPSGAGLRGSPSDPPSSASDMPSSASDMRSSSSNDSMLHGYNIEEALNAAGLGKFQWLLMLYVGMAWFGDAMEMMLLSFLSPEVSCQWSLTGSQESWISSVVFIGMCFGAYTFGSLSDVMGRKVGIFATAAFTSVMGLASAAAPNYEMLLLFRGLVGVGLGGVPVAFAMLAEVTPAKHRGTFLIIMEIFWSLGAVFQAGIAWWILPRWGWRWLLAVSALPLLFLLFFYPVIPESPRYLASSGQRQAAIDVLEKIAKTNGTELPPGTLTTVAHKTGKLSGASDDWLAEIIGQFPRLFSPSLWSTTMVVWSLWFASSLGYYGIILLTTELHAGASGSCAGGTFTFADGDYSSIFIDTLGELPVFAVALLVDVVGRKWLLVGCFLASMVSLSPMLFTLQYSTLALFCSRLFVESAFNVTYVYTPEAYPTHVRTYALGVANMFGRVGGVMAPFIAQDLFRKTTAVGDAPSVAVSVFIGMSFFGAFSAGMIPRETAGQALLEDDEDDSETEHRSRDKGLKQRLLAVPSSVESEGLEEP